jgi:hypothetical protein
MFPPSTYASSFPSHCLCYIPNPWFLRKIPHDSSVSLTFSLHLYPVLVLLRPPILYHFHSIHYHPHTFQTLSDLNPPARLLLFTVQLHYRTSNNTPFQHHISRPRPLPHLTQLTCYSSQSSTTGTTIPTCVSPLSLHTSHLFGLLEAEVMALHSLKTLGTTHPTTMSHLISTAIRPSSFSS